MASFRTGFKIIGEISLKQGLGRIRSFSEDRKPGQWLPEDQWAVRHPGSTCPDPCEKPKKPPKPSKSWLSICKDPETPIECDVRHNNCPPPPVKGDAPWYSLDNLIPKKKPEKTPPLQSCREEMKRREVFGEEEEVCENIVDKTFPDNKPELPESCMPKREPCPAPVVTLSCPLPKELDIMLWCGRPCTDTSRIAAKCQSDKLPYQEFRPQKCWQPPPFSLPVKGDPTSFNSSYCTGPLAYAEFKQVEIPRPLYTRYKSVELSDSNLLLCMTEVKCPNDETHCVPVKPQARLPPPPLRQHRESREQEEKVEACPEKVIIEAASCKPVKIKKAPKYTFRPKPTKLVEKRIIRNPCAQHKTCNLQFRPPEEKKESKPIDTSACEPPKVITGTLTTEPQMYERNLSLACNPPRWMYNICKPGSKKSPLMPGEVECPKEPPDWCSETDGLNFYDGKDEGIIPKPRPDPCLSKTEAVEKPEPPPAPVECPKPVPEFRNRFVLMPESYNIKNMRPKEHTEVEDEVFTFEKFIEANTAIKKKCSKSYPQMKENILYDLQRLCPNLPIDSSKLNAPCRKPPEPACYRPPTFTRGFATISSSALQKLCSVQLIKTPLRTECGDTSGKCKPRDMTPKPKPCPPEKPKPTCADIALPCCSKPRLPPACDAKKPVPLCKKKLPPKPSFSECSKDPPPCPKMTECNCWEKVGGKNRKFSDWAAKRAVGKLKGCSDTVRRHTENSLKAIQTNSRNSRPSRYSSIKSQYAGKVKCYTLKSIQPSPNSAENKLMLGLKDPKVDSYCEYEQKSIVTKQKRHKREFKERDKYGNKFPKQKKSPKPQTNNITFQNRELMNEDCGIMTPGNDLKMNANSVMMEPSQDLKCEKSHNEMREKENSVTLCSSQPNEENSKDFMESIGSWINDLFTVPNKRLCTAPKSDNKEIQKSLVLEEDTEYLKSISHIKEQFRKKLKSETSVHLSNADKPFEFHFVKVLENERKGKKRIRSMPLISSSDCLEEFKCLNANDELDQIMSDGTTQGNNSPQTGGPLIRKNDKDITPQPVHSSLFLDSSNLVKKKKKIYRVRSEVNKLEEYVLPSPSELSKRILLNINPNEHEKGFQFYKNPHLGVQEAQHYAPRKTKPCQSNTRCYTTNANVTDAAENPHSNAPMTMNRHSHCFAGDSPEMKTEEVSPTKSSLDFKKTPYRKTQIKNVPELSKDTLSFVSVRPTKSPMHMHLESIKNESKATSDDLVKYLMKKIKLSGRSHHAKKKTTTVPQVLNNRKNKFMQSATNSLVMSVMAKKENDPQGASKIRMLTDNKQIKNNLPSREFMVKYPYGNIRFDVSRALNFNKFNKSTYLMEEDKLDGDADLPDKGGYKNSRRPYEDLLKKDVKKNIDKIAKRQEVRQMLSKIDTKFVTSPTIKPKELKKKAVKTLLDNLEVDENKDSPNPRFLKQHELFKNNTKTMPAAEEQDSEQDDPPSPNPISKELALINPDSHMTLANLQEKNVVISNQQDEMISDETCDDNKMTDLQCIEENTPSMKAEVKPPVKPSFCKEKLNKSRSQNFLKENDSKNILNSLPEYYSSESANQNEALNSCETALCPPDLRPMKSMDTLFFNRRYSTKTVMENNRRNKPIHQPRKFVASLTNIEKDSEGSKKKEAKEKQKVKTPKNGGMEENDIDTTCGFEKMKKKPGPNCEADESKKS